MVEWRNGGIADVMAEWRNGNGMAELRNGGMAESRNALRRCKGSPFSVHSTCVREKDVATIAFIVSFRYIRMIIILLSTHGRHPRNVDGVRNNGRMVEW